MIFLLNINICERRQLLYGISIKKQKNLYNSLAIQQSRDRCYDFKIFLPKNLANILGFFAQTTNSFLKKN
jgi:hypothetical protein